MAQVNGGSIILRGDSHMNTSDLGVMLLFLSLFLGFFLVVIGVSNFLKSLRTDDRGERIDRFFIRFLLVLLGCMVTGVGVCGSLSLLNHP